MITAEDREKHPHHTDDSILGVKLIGGVRDEVLLSIQEHGRKAEGFGALWTLMGNNTNPRWIGGQVAEELYERGLVTEVQFDALSERYS